VQIIDLIRNKNSITSSRLTATNTREYIDAFYDINKRSFVYEFPFDFTQWYLDKDKTERIEVIVVFMTYKGYTGSITIPLKV
jgi:hypothetical protein